MNEGMEKFLKDLYKFKCRQTECYQKGIYISLTINFIMLLVMIASFA